MQLSPIKTAAVNLTKALGSYYRHRAHIRILAWKRYRAAAKQLLVPGCLTLLAIGVTSTDPFSGGTIVEL